ncbi:hypothetical protein C3L33_00923, partial [Rhododendron williamsianum]
MVKQLVYLVSIATEVSFVSAAAFKIKAFGLTSYSDALDDSSQSRADLLTLGLAATNILAGLVWLSIRPKTIVAVNPQGMECLSLRLNSHLPDFVIFELICSDDVVVLRCADLRGCDDATLLLCASNERGVNGNHRQLNSEQRIDKLKATVNLDRKFHQLGAYVSYMDFCFLGIELDSEGMLLSLWPA